MEENELKIFQTAIFLIDKGYNEILKNDLLPYIKKAQKIVEELKR